MSSLAGTIKHRWILKRGSELPPPIAAPQITPPTPSPGVASPDGSLKYKAGGRKCAACLHLSTLLCKRRPGSDFVLRERFDKVSSCRSLPLSTVAPVNSTPGTVRRVYEVAKIVVLQRKEI